MKPIALWKSLVFACLMITAGCGDDGPANGLDDGEARLGPAGGRLEGPDGDAAVLVPPGALGAPSVLSIRRLEPGEVPPALAALRLVSRVYRFGPDGLRFSRPARVEIFFDADQLPSGVALEDLTIGRLTGAGQIEELADVQVIIPPGDSRVRLHATRRGIGGLASSFSPFAVFVDPSPGSAPITTRAGSTPGEDSFTIVD